MLSLWLEGAGREGAQVADQHAQLWTDIWSTLGVRAGNSCRWRESRRAGVKVVGDERGRSEGSHAGLEGRAESAVRVFWAMRSHLSGLERVGNVEGSVCGLLGFAFWKDDCGCSVGRRRKGSQSEWQGTGLESACWIQERRWWWLSGSWWKKRQKENNDACTEFMVLRDSTWGW